MSGSNQPFWSQAQRQRQILHKLHLYEVGLT